MAYGIKILLEVFPTKIYTPLRGIFREWISLFRMVPILFPIISYTGFVIGFGDRLYRSCFSDWSNEFEILRHELEGLVVHGGGKVELHFEDDPNVIEVRGRYLHDTRDSSCVEVTFKPDGFVGGPILFGFCKSKEVVEKLYYGFMDLFSRDTSWFDDGHEGVTWDEFRTIAIAKLKSQIVEDYLKE